ncbi:MAG TPA: sialidase family protein [Candidatus Dormibacteraeota bacterium]|nr:sialidase family protein [Candidatus Dormibacteraeota bacterium]
MGKVRIAAVVSAIGLCMSAALVAHAASGVTYTPDPQSQLVSSCSGQNAEVEQAAASGYIYEEWMGCGGIAFARSSDGGHSWSSPIAPPGSVGSTFNSWDPALAVGPGGRVYAAFMRAKDSQWYPVVDVSTDNGATFTQSVPLIPPDSKNWGDRDFIAVGPATSTDPYGTVYVTYDYGPQRTSVTSICSSSGSCAFLTGDLNVVMQQSTDGGLTWSPMSYVSPGFPASGGDSGPMVIEPSGRVDVLYQGYQITNTTTYAMNPAHSYFTASNGCTIVSQTRGGLDCGWSSPVQVGGDKSGTMSLWEWWIDGDLGIDSAGNLYATWDTQVSNLDGSTWTSDTAWLSYSINGGKTWTRAIQVPPDTSATPHIVEVAGGGSGTAYVTWLSYSNGTGYAEYLRTYAIGNGWIPISGATGPDTSTFTVSGSLYGNTSVWPGDTTGISFVSPANVVVSWGSTNGPADKKDEIWVTNIAVS